MNVAGRRPARFGRWACAVAVALAGMVVLVGLGAAPAWSQSRRLVLEETEITGKVRKPEITLFISRQNLDADYDLVLKESFVPKILEAAETKPF